ncbi:MAG: cycloartenol synthase, partial [Verrucomicrobia bacterium]|nr:cycloartenol synthase [Verrucomicrobiota bacterium]
SENPGLEQKEVFLYYLLMAKAWTVMNVHDATSVGGAHLEWRHALALRLLNLQQPNGSWMNETPEGMEQDPVLTTSYALITLEMIYSGL